ncbi:MAG: flagellar hook-length control protein FliK [Lachnospiraceae bacterium]|uniref:Flagellar hook-length control protein FliK n=1 Tax=Candidatus Weimeria bifida TaxID=2599074 RepID=A0A6N7IZ03_9FIRM|nr:flagellar hook-length control protein FliK [Candidatus Weimeria bifida]RRF96106.1 MAG: flagellar hook-length control protein FliK [Lachnospiraceae bacterium]
MEIRNLVNQYYSNGVSSEADPAKAQGVEQLTSALNALKEGAVFEGTVNNIRGSEVLLGLSSGQNITARLLGDIALAEGESVFFQVKKNDGNEVVIKPVSIGASTGNPIIENALISAQLPVTDQTVAMVDEMIKNKMPIDSKSIASVGREVLLNPEADPKMAVVLKNLGIPVDSETLTQINNYKESSDYVASDLKDLSEAFSNIASENNENFDAVTEIINNVFSDGDDAISDMAFENPLSAETALNEAGEAVSAGDGSSAASNMARTEAADINPGEIDRSAFPQGTIGNTLGSDDFKKLSDFMNSNTALKENFPGLFNEIGQLKPDALTKDVFLSMKALFDTRGSEFIRANMKNSGFPELMKAIISDKYLLTPEEAVDKQRINDSFNRLSEDVTKAAQQAAEKLPQREAAQINSLSQQVQSNVNFIKQVNTVYNYVQIPLKMLNQNATSELFVYADKKKKHWDPDEPLTAFLHLDLEHLGSTDISVKLLKKKLDTNFSLADDESYMLIENNIHFLQEKLESMGYNCTISVKNTDVKRNFVDDFLKQDVKTNKAKSGKQILRYSFDVRA